MTAAGAEAVQFKAMGLDCEPVPRGHFLLELFNLAVFKLNDFPATGADEVIMVTFVCHIIVLSLRPEMTGLGQTGITEEVQCPVDGGQSQMRIGFSKLMIHGFGCDVFLTQEGGENELALACEFQLMLGKVFLQRFHLPRIFARCHGKRLQARSLKTKASGWSRGSD